MTNEVRAFISLIDGSKAVRDVFVRAAEPALVLNIGSDYGYPVKDVYPYSSRVLPPMMLKFPDSYDPTSSAGSYPTEFDFESSETFWGTYPTTLTITAGNRFEVIEVDVLGLASCVNGSNISGIYNGTLTKTVTQLGSEITMTGGYRKMFTLRVHVNHAKSDLGTMKKITISGPELVLDGDQAIYSAIGTFIKDGKEVNYEITSDGLWSGSAFENSVGCGVFTNAQYSSNMQEVKFNFNGYDASFPVRVYRYSKFRHEFVDLDDVYKVKGFWMLSYYPGASVFKGKPNAFCRVHELKIIEDFCDVNNIVKNSRERSYYVEKVYDNVTYKYVGLGVIDYYSDKICTSEYDAALKNERSFDFIVNSSSSYLKDGSFYPQKISYNLVSEGDEFKLKRTDQTWEDALGFTFEKVN